MFFALRSARASLVFTGLHPAAYTFVSSVLLWTCHLAVAFNPSSPGMLSAREHPPLSGLSLVVLHRSNRFGDIASGMASGESAKKHGSKQGIGSDDARERDALATMKVSALRKRAIAAGVAEDAIEVADDADNTKEALITLILADSTAKRQELAVMKTSALRKRAIAAGIEEDALEAADDADNTKAMLIDLILMHSAKVSHSTNPELAHNQTDSQDSTQSSSQSSGQVDTPPSLLRGVPRGVLGPPTHLEALRVGLEVLPFSRQCTLSGNRIDCQLARIATRPACFQVSNLISEAECDHLMTLRESLGMNTATSFVVTEDAKMVAGSNRLNCSMTSVSARSDSTVEAMFAICQQLFLQPQVLQPSDWSNGVLCERMNLLKYAEGGQYKLHLDANEKAHRIITVLFYLNGVGATWLPHAVQDPIAAQKIANYNPSPGHALATGMKMTPGEDGVAPTPRKGDALVFYNFLNDGSGSVDSLSLHAGLPAPAEKSIATIWFHVDFNPLKRRNALQR